MRSKSESTKRFFVASGITNILAYAIFVAIEFIIKPSHHFTSLIFASLGVLPIAYALNRVWVFQSTNNLKAEMLRYTLVYFSGLALSSVMLYTLLKIFPNVYVAQLASMAVIGISALVVHTFWTFIRKT
jgi:putative flippase GtrA